MDEFALSCICMAGTLLCLFVFNLDCGRIGLGFRRSNGNYMFGSGRGPWSQADWIQVPSISSLLSALFLLLFGPWDLRRLSA